MKKPTEFIYLRGVIFKLAQKLSRNWMPLDQIYERLWNPINYVIVGGVGVIINMLVSALFWAFLRIPDIWLIFFCIPTWFSINAIAISIAWLWNWANSVGPLGWAWGFRQKGGKKNANKRKNK